jgi:TPR repeat protein
MQAKWYLRAAEGGNVRAMYNICLCYSYGEGLAQDPVRAKRWLQLAADCGHKKALYECGIKLCAVCHSSSLSDWNSMYGFVYLKKDLT